MTLWCCAGVWDRDDYRYAHHDEPDQRPGSQHLCHSRSIHRHDHDRWLIHLLFFLYWMCVKGYGRTRLSVCVCDSHACCSA